MSKLARLRAFVLLGALLLFGMEPLVGRLLLPSSGGGFHVWAACLLFFQTALFLGYLYTHLFSKWVGRGHILLALAPLLFLPIGRFLRELDPDPSSPTASILGVLTLSIAVPFVLLSTTGVIAQRWLAESDLPERENPYQLYAASNAGSFVALLSYPLVFEPLFGLQAQRWVWSAAYLVYLGLAISLVPRGSRAAGAAPEPAGEVEPAGEGEPAGEAAESAGAAPASQEPGPAAEAAAKEEAAPAEAANPNEIDSASSEDSEAVPEKVSPGLFLAWLVLAAVPSACLVAVTNVIAMDLGSLPMVWVVPLCIYLLSFVLTFGPKERYPAFVRRLTPEVLTLGFCLWLLGGQFTWLAGLGHLLVLSWVCWVGHGELYRARPAPSRLTTFYLSVSLGGWIGGFLVTFVAPRAFTGLWEYPLALGALLVALLGLRGRKIMGYVRAAHPAQIGISAIAIALALLYVGIDRALITVHPEAYRNEYGIYKVGTVPLRGPRGEAVRIKGEVAELRAMSHGTIIHGKEILQAPGVPIGYFHGRAPLGRALKQRPAPAKIAIVGLGAGAMAGNLRPGDELTFYEIDPDVEVLARKHFTYLERSRGSILPMRAGDARLELSKDPQGTFDVIMVDAFSSDAIPIHLLTREALDVYRARLKPDGWLILHISSRYYDLRPVVRATARSLDPPMAGVIQETINAPPEELVKLALRFEDPSSTYVLAATSELLEPLHEVGFKDDTGFALPELSPWSDDYANILGPLWARYTRKD
jgi:hypothetical protein